MPKNLLVQKICAARKEGYTEGLWKGLQFGLNLCAIANNHLYGHGDGRLTRTQDYVQKLVDEIVDVNDPEVTDAHIHRELKRIRGKGWKG